MRIAVAAIAADRDHGALAGLIEVGEQGFLVLGKDLGADRDLHGDAVGRGAGAVGTRAIAALARLEVLGIAIVDQGVEAINRLDHHIAAAAAIAAIRAAELDVFLAPERDDAVTAVAGLHEHLGFIEEFHRGSSMRML